MTTTSLRAVIFDMDGVILDTEPVHRAAWQRAAAGCGFRITDEMYAECLGRTDADGAAILLRTFGEAFPLPKFRSCRALYWREHVALHGVRTKPGLFDLLDLLDTHRLPRAVATGTHRATALGLLDRARLRDRFSLLVGGDEVPRGKPEPDIYLAAAARLGVSPGDCLVLEDSGPGACAARAAGMRVVLIPDLAPPSAETAAQAHAVRASLCEVGPLVLATFRE